MGISQVTELRARQGVDQPLFSQVTGIASTLSARFMCKQQTMGQAAAAVAMMRARVKNNK
jgi:hypothetical protein